MVCQVGIIELKASRDLLPEGILFAGREIHDVCLKICGAPLSSAVPPAGLEYIAAMQPMFCFTLDTEPDDLWSEGITFEHFRNLTDFHVRLSDAGARVTHLTTSEVAEDPMARDVMQGLLDRGDCEIGAHFHTWTREWPFEVPDLGADPIKALAHNLGDDVERNMLTYTCNALRDAFGVAPRSFRGGRWSWGPETARSLIANGISVDSSMTPTLSWRDPSHPYVDGPDWTDLDCQPFLIDEPAPTPDARLVELPVGANDVTPDWVRNSLPAGLPHRIANKLLRTAGKVTGPVSLRPTYLSVPQMEACMRQLMADECPVWVFMIHSSEIARCEPLPTDEEVARFIERCEASVKVAVSLGARGVTLAEAGDWVRANAPTT
jgi:hypothetical protein